MISQIQTVQGQIDNLSTQAPQDFLEFLSKERIFTLVALQDR